MLWTKRNIGFRAYVCQSLWTGTDEQLRSILKMIKNEELEQLPQEVIDAIKEVS